MFVTDVSVWNELLGAVLQTFSLILMGDNTMNDPARFRNQPIPLLVLSMSSPVMFSLLVQALYNIVDTICISSYSPQHGLSALSLAFPLQLVLNAVANGTGAGAGILISRAEGEKKFSEIPLLTSSALFGAILSWGLACVLMLPVLSLYYHFFSQNTQMIAMGVQYCRIVIFLSIFLFVESVCTRIVQAHGCTLIPMLYQALGAVINIILDPLMVFGMGLFPALGVSGAAIATVLGQGVAMMCAILTMFLGGHLTRPSFKMGFLLSIYCAGFPAMLTSALVSVYVTGLNGVLSAFSEEAVTSLGIYYKIQTFVLIPTCGMEHGILPILSYNIGAGNQRRTLGILHFSLVFSTFFLVIAMIGTNMFLPLLLRLLSATPQLTITAIPALRIISTAFPLFGITILIPTLLQAAGHTRECLSVVILRQVILLVPLAVVLSKLGLTAVWFTFPISEIIAAAVCIVLLLRYRRRYMYAI